MPHCRIYTVSQEGQLWMILEHLNVSRILPKKLDCVQGTLLLMALKEVFHGLLDQAIKLLISSNSHFNH